MVGRKKEVVIKKKNFIYHKNKSQIKTVYPAKDFCAHVRLLFQDQIKLYLHLNF